MDHLTWARNVGRHAHDASSELKVRLVPTQCGPGKGTTGRRQNDELLLEELAEGAAVGDR